VQRARHIEVQIFGDGAGNVVAFPERECSIQVRHMGRAAQPQVCWGAVKCGLTNMQRYCWIATATL